MSSSTHIGIWHIRMSSINRKQISDTGTSSVSFVAKQKQNHEIWSEKNVRNQNFSKTRSLNSRPIIKQPSYNCLVGPLPNWSMRKWLLCCCWDGMCCCCRFWCDGNEIYTRPRRPPWKPWSPERTKCEVSASLSQIDPPLPKIPSRPDPVGTSVNWNENDERLFCSFCATCYQLHVLTIASLSFSRKMSICRSVKDIVHWLTSDFFWLTSDSMTVFSIWLCLPMTKATMSPV